MSNSSEANELFSAWMREHGAIPAKVSRAYGRTARDRAELEQEMLFQVWDSAHRFNALASPATWIYRVCLNTAFNWRRASSRRDRRAASDEAIEAMPGGSPGPDVLAERRDLLEQLFQALLALSETDRALLLLQLDGLAYGEIGQVLGLSENHVGVALSRARRRLAVQMKGIVNELE